MSMNTAHANGGVLIFNGEMILLYCDGVELVFEGQDVKEFGGTKKGRIYLTSHRMIFTNKNSSDHIQSFSFPFFSMTSIDLQQPIFGANYIKGTVTAQAGGNWTGQAIFKLKFLTGGAIEFGQAMLQAAKMAGRYMPPQPPAYTPQVGPYYAAQPPAYTPPPGGYYGFVPPTHVFPNAPPANSVFMTDMPPPYPGIHPPAYAGIPQQGYPLTGGFPQQGYPPAGGLPQQPPGYPPTGGLPQQPPGYPPTGGLPQQPPGYPPSSGYNSGPPAPGFNPGIPQNHNFSEAPMFNGSAAPPPQAPQNPSDAKAQEAILGAYYNPYSPNQVYVPQTYPYQQPPQCDGPPPPYSEAQKKQQ